MEHSSGSLQQVTTGAGQDVEVAVSPDSKRLAYATLRQNADIWRLPVSPQTGLSTGTPEAVISTTREDSRGSWSPDSKMVAFNSDRAGDMNIWLFTLADSSTRQLTTGHGGDFQAELVAGREKDCFLLFPFGKPEHLGGGDRQRNFEASDIELRRERQSVLLAGRKTDRLPVGPERSA